MNTLAGFFLLALFQYMYKDFKKTEEEKQARWHKTRQKGLWPYVITRGVLGWGLVVALNIWALDTDFTEDGVYKNLFFYLSIYPVLGVFIGGKF
ncbi:hypothetical protein LF817_19345 [Halobacillus sp. A1]|uniref:hypothetical protein n=1 Tax=Halobacillus sp. A1 TaxID=2880262 RepID=UPI0020A65FE5|nr:hypothetical protein [Halobacillus sp. A1]MCP3033483.1 hypothetical protein [Halobacillus sp. A1]